MMKNNDEKMGKDLRHQSITDVIRTGHVIDKSGGSYE